MGSIPGDAQRVLRRGLEECRWGLYILAVLLSKQVAALQGYQSRGSTDGSAQRLDVVEER